MANLFAGIQSVSHRNRIVALLPAIRADFSSAFAVLPGIHHHNAIAVPQKELRMAEHAGTIVGYAVIHQNPVAVR